METGSQETYTYHPQIFTGLKTFISLIPDLYESEDPEPDTLYEKLPEPLTVFLKENSFDHYLRECRENATGKTTFVKRFFHWFNAFKCMKYIHFARDHYYPNIPVKEAANQMVFKLGMGNKKLNNEKILFTTQL